MDETSATRGYGKWSGTRGRLSPADCVVPSSWSNPRRRSPWPAAAEPVETTEALVFIATGIRWRGVVGYLAEFLGDIRSVAGIPVLVSVVFVSFSGRIMALWFELILLESDHLWSFASSRLEISLSLVYNLFIGLLFFLVDDLIDSSLLCVLSDPPAILFFDLIAELWLPRSKVTDWANCRLSWMDFEDLSLSIPGFG